MANGLEGSLEGSVERLNIRRGSMRRFLKHIVPISGDIKFWKRLQEPEVTKINRIHAQDRAAYFFAATTLKYAAYTMLGYALIKTFSR